MELVVGTIGRANGLRGDVAIDVRSDTPEARFAIGTVLATDPPGVGPLTVERARHLGERWVVGFREVADRTGAEALRGVALVVEAEDSQDDDAWYPHELAGLRVELLDGTVVGEVVGLQSLPAQDALVVRETGGATTLVPFVRAIVPVVDVRGGRVVLDPPAGLLASDEVEDEEPEPDDDDLDDDLDDEE